MEPQSSQKLFLLDAFALIYRAYFAFSNNHRINSKGLNTSAIFGFTNTLLDVLKKEKPTHIAVVFDTPEETHRHVEFAAYKAQRDEMPEDLALAIPYVIRLIEAFNIPVIAMPGYEADDVIGTLAKKGEQKGFITYMMTPDKDFGQLVTDKILIYKPARAGGGAEVLGIKEVCARYDIERTEQVIDILGLMGDSVDNIPGIPGVGEKTAIQLLKQFGSIENLLANTDQLKGKLKEKVELNKDMAIQSKRLATIILDAPVEFDEAQLILKEPNKDALRELFAELEFRNLAQRILGEELPAGESSNTKSSASTNGQTNLFDTNTDVATTTDNSDSSEEGESSEPKIFNTIETVQHHYKTCADKESRTQLVAELLKHKELSFDTETTGVDTMQAELVGLSFAVRAHEGWYVPLPANYDEARAIVQEFKSVYENENCIKVGQNIKYDVNMLRWYDIEVKGTYFDTMLAHYVIKPEMRHNMDLLAETYLNYAPVSIETLIGKKGKDQGSMRDVAIDKITEYATEDADITLQLKAQFEPLLKETATEKLFNEVETPLITVLAAMEREGIKLDVATMKDFSLVLQNDIADFEKQIQELAGTPFNVSSPKQVGDILFEVLKIVDKPKKTKTGQYATSEDVITKLSGKHPIVDKILDYRELVKLKSTYVDALPLMVNPRTGKIHTSFNQVVAVTGRLSSDNPNLQNIPIRTERGREVRKAFIPRNSDFVLLSADYSQVELRVIAEVSKDAAMIEAFKSGLDIHTATAAKVFGVEPAAVTSDMRRNAKMVNFGIIYGISAFGLSERLNIPRKEAAEIIDNYFKQYPGIRDYMDECIVKAKKLGYVETILGRKRYLRDINSGNANVRGFAERNAINAPIQGSAADMIKMAMINIHHEFEKNKLRSRMLLQVHDELVFDLHREEEAQVKEIVADKMRHALPLTVPIEVEMGTGENWLEAH